MNKLIETAKEIDRILKSGIEVHPNSPIHEKLKQALNIPPVVGQNEQYTCECKVCGKPFGDKLSLYEHYNEEHN